MFLDGVTIVTSLLVGIMSVQGWHVIISESGIYSCVEIAVD